MNDIFDEFFAGLTPEAQTLVKELDTFLTNSSCKRTAKAAKSGCLVTYLTPGTKKALANLVTRKTGIKVRIYAAHVGVYQLMLDALPENMKQDIRKASDCKRLLNPADCNPKCSMGYAFTMDGTLYQKCRNMAFMPALNNENAPFIQGILAKELSAAVQ